MHKQNIIGVTLSRTLNSTTNVNRLPAFNFILNATRRDFLERK